jgi:hypothetical protein
MNCKKGDFGGVKDQGVSLQNRKRLFYGICIWVRLGLVYLAYVLRKKKWFPYSIIVICLLSLYFIKFDKDTCVWWSRKMHQIMVYIILVAALYQVITEDVRPIISILIFIDLILGIISSFLLKWR